jgi:hypothetical protein
MIWNELNSRIKYSKTILKHYNFFFFGLMVLNDFKWFENEIIFRRLFKHIFTY